MEEMEKLRRKAEELRGWLAVAVFFLVFLAIVSMVSHNNLSNENEALMEERATLEDKVESLTSDLNEYESYLEAKDNEIIRLQNIVDSMEESGSSYYGESAYLQSDTQSITVYVTNTGSKYHENGCQYLRESKIAISLSNAKAQGYDACSRCY